MPAWRRGKRRISARAWRRSWKSGSRCGQKDSRRSKNVTADELVAIITVHPLRRIALLAACHIHVLHLHLGANASSQALCARPVRNGVSVTDRKEQIDESDVKVNRSSGSLL